MNKIVNFYVTRHGETLFNQLDKVQGWSDSPLSAKGICDAKTLGNSLAQITFNKIFSSDSQRAVNTASIVKESANIVAPVHTDLRLREWSYGNLEGEPNKNIMSLIRQNFPDSDMFALNQQIPQVRELLKSADTSGWAEDFPTIEKRLKSFFQETAELCNNNDNVLVVTHAFTIKTLFYLYGRKFLSTFDRVNNLALSVLIYENGSFYFKEANKSI